MQATPTQSHKHQPLVHFLFVRDQAKTGKLFLQLSTYKPAI